MPIALDADLIHRSIKADDKHLLDQLEVLDVVPSTNTWLMEQEQPAPGRFRAVLAEHQTAGRGRRSRRWYSPARAGLCLSLAYTFKKNPEHLSCLTLAAGVGVVRALKKLGAIGLALKWPNDIYACDAKLGGILTDVRTGSGGQISMVCGVGLNVDLSLAESKDGNRDALRVIDYSVTDLRCHMDELPDRSEIAGVVLGYLIDTTSDFENAGLGPFREYWEDVDWLQGRLIEVDTPDGIVRGTAEGIDAHGGMMITTREGRRRVYTGTVRVAEEVEPVS